MPTGEPVPTTANAAGAGVSLGGVPLLGQTARPPETISDWLVLVGSAVGALSFLLPWAPGIANYTSSWGLATISNLPILLLLVATSSLAILPNPVAAWIRSGVLGLAGGSLFLGLLWPYVVGDFGTAIGSIAAAAASLAMVVGGIGAIAPRAETSS